MAIVVANTVATVVSTCSGHGEYHDNAMSDSSFPVILLSTVALVTFMMHALQNQMFNNRSSSSALQSGKAAFTPAVSFTACWVSYES